MKHTMLFRILAMIFVALFICASLLKSTGWYSSFFKVAESIVGGDKLLHIIATFCIAFLVNLATSTCRRHPPKQFFNQTIVYLFVLVSADEVLQLISINRRFSFADLTASYVGLLLGWAACRLLLKTTIKDHDQCP